MIDLCSQRCPALGVSRGRRHGQLAPPPQRSVQGRGSPRSPLMRRPQLFAPSDPDISCLGLRAGPHLCSMWTHVTWRERACVFLPLLPKQEGKIGGLFSIFFLNNKAYM